MISVYTRSTSFLASFVLHFLWTRATSSSGFVPTNSTPEKPTITFKLMKWSALKVYTKRDKL